MSDDDIPPATPAATLVLMRDIAGAVPELLMIERADTMSFAAGAMVFPGGKVEQDDRTIAAAAAIDDQGDAAARVAAIRECLEEVGLAVGFEAPPEVRAALRSSLAAGEPFSELLAARGLKLDLTALTPFARWRPRFKEAKKLFDTRFYIAAAPEGEIEADGGESVHALWVGARVLLDEAADEKRHIIFPTMCNLERLATLASFADARAHAAAFPVRMISPEIAQRNGEMHLCIPDDLGYPVTSQTIALVKRG